MTTAAPLRSARANAPPATPVDGFVFEAFEAAFELLSDLLSVALLSEDELSEDELSEAELLVSDEASELLTLSGCEEAGDTIYCPLCGNCHGRVFHAPGKRCAHCL